MALNAREKMLYVFLGLGAVVAVLVAGLTWLKPRYDQIVSLDENVQKEWANIEALLQKRYDLLPNLVSTVKGYAQHEKDLFLGVEQARSGWNAASGINGRMQASYETDRRYHRVLNFANRFPQIKADRSFMRLMDNLEGLEGELATQRMTYNGSVKSLNELVRSFEGRFVATFVGAQVAPYYEPPAYTAGNPIVDFVGDRPDATRVSQPPGAAAPAGGAGGGAPAGAVADVKFRGSAGSGGNMTAILEMPDGSSMNVRRGQRLPAVNATVLTVAADAVILETPSGDGTKTVRVGR